MPLKKKVLSILVFTMFGFYNYSYSQSDIKSEIKSDKRNVGDYMKLVEDKNNEGQFKEAALSIDKMVSFGTIMPPELLYHYGRIYAKAGDKVKSVKLINEAVDKGFWSINRVKEDIELKSALGQKEMEVVLNKIRAVTIPYSTGKAVISQQEKKSILDLAQRGLKTWYFDPKVATEMSVELTRMFNDGHFDGIDTLSKFNDALVNYFRKRTNDKHFYIGVNHHDLTEKIPNVNLLSQEERNFGFREVAVREGNVGYIRWDECVAGPEAYKSAQNALNLVRNTRAIIFDISANGGGNGEISTFLYHYLFKPDDKRFETLLIKKCKNELEWHRSEPPVAPLSGGPDLGDKPVYIVISGNTFSAAEYFAFMMKELNRGTIIGKNTGGGGNPVNIHREGRFVMYVPTCQIKTNTGKSLEGKGVSPDIEFVSQDWAKEMMNVVNADLKKK